MRKVTFQNQECYLSLTAKNYTEIIKIFMNQIDAQEQHVKELTNIKNKLQKYLDEFKKSKWYFNKTRLALKIRKLESDLNNKTIIVNNFQKQQRLVYLFTAAFHMLRDKNNNRMFTDYEDFMVNTDIESVSNIENDIEALLQGKPVEEYTKEIEKAKRKRVKDAKKKLQSIRNKITLQTC